MIYDVCSYLKIIKTYPVGPQSQCQWLIRGSARKQTINFVLDFDLDDLAYLNLHFISLRADEKVSQILFMTSLPVYINLHILHHLKVITSFSVCYSSNSLHQSRKVTSFSVYLSWNSLYKNTGFNIKLRFVF